MLRIATIEDAEQLFVLNENFNGKGVTTLDSIKNSIINNKQEVIIVAEENHSLVGFLCIQLKKSFCYHNYSAEITEVFINPMYRRQRIASHMIAFAEQYCMEQYAVQKFEILTGKTNLVAQALYHGLGYSDDGEMHMTKRIKSND